MMNTRFRKKKLITETINEIILLNKNEKNPNKGRLNEYKPENTKKKTYTADANDIWHEYEQILNDNAKKKKKLARKSQTIYI